MNCAVATPYRLAPSSPETEQAVLGACLMHPAAYHTAASIIGDKPVFHEKQLAEIWRILCDWYQEHPNTRPDRAWFISQTGCDGLASITSECVNNSCLSPNIPYHCNELLKFWRLRRSRDLAGTLVRAVDCGNTETVEAVLRDIGELNNDTESTTGLHLSSVVDAPEVPVPLFSNGIPRAGFGLLVGGDGTGKGFLLADLLLSCATGRQVSIPTLSRCGDPLRTLYLSYEDATYILKWRLNRICEGAGMDVSVWCDAARVGRLSFLCEPEPLYIQRGSDAPQGTNMLARLRQHIIHNHLDLVVIDPLSACAILQNENDNSAINVVACSLRAMAAETDCAMLLVHHTSKAGRHISGDHQAARGGSALGGAARWVLSLAEDASNSNLLDTSVSKNSYGRRVYGIMLSRDPDTGVLREMTGQEIGKAKDRLLDNVVRFVKDHPILELNPNAVKNRKSEGAKKLIEAVDAKPKEVYEAIMRAVKSGALATEERERPNRTGTYEVLVLPFSDVDSESDNEDLF